MDGLPAWTAYSESGIVKDIPALEIWCKAECDKWVGCEATMDFDNGSGRVFRAGGGSTGSFGICHIAFGAADLAAAQAQWDASPLNTGSCNQALRGGCWTFHPHVYPEATCEKKKVAAPVVAGGSNKNLGQRFSIQFCESKKGGVEWDVHPLLDAGWGFTAVLNEHADSVGIASTKRRLVTQDNFVDTTTVMTNTDDVWSGANQKDKNLHIKFTVQQGCHELVIYSSEGCCDGNAGAWKFKRADDQFRLLSIVNLATIGKRSIDEGAQCTNKWDPAFIGGRHIQMSSMVMTSPHTSSCVSTSKAEVLFVLDQSGSVGRKEFGMMKDWMKRIVSRLDIGSSGVRVAATKYSNDALLQWTLSDGIDMNELMAKIDSITYGRGGTYTGKAIQHAYDTMFSDARAGINRVTIVITDGLSHDNAVGPSQKLKTMVGPAGATMKVFALGVGKTMGSGNGAREIEAIASSGGLTNEYAFTVINFGMLDSIADRLVTDICTEVRLTGTDSDYLVLFYCVYTDLMQWTIRTSRSHTFPLLSIASLSFTCLERRPDGHDRDGGR
jgi:hypothetical protein